MSKAEQQRRMQPNYVESKKYPQATVEQEKFIDAQTGGDKYKEAEEYEKFLTTKKSAEFLNLRRDQISNLVQMKADATDIAEKKKYDIMIKGATFADFAREQAMKNGVADIYSTDDNEVYNKMLVQPEHHAAFVDYIN